MNARVAIGEFLVAPFLLNFHEDVMKRKQTPFDPFDDVVAQAGVSRSSVSRVLDNPDFVADETRARALEIF